MNFRRSHEKGKARAFLDHTEPEDLWVAHCPCCGGVSLYEPGYHNDCEWCGHDLGRFQRLVIHRLDTYLKLRMEVTNEK